MNNKKQSVPVSESLSDARSAPSSGAQPDSLPDPLQDPALRGPSVWEMLRDLVRNEPRPLHCVQVEITSRCAARCIYCPHTTAGATWRSRHMEDSTFAALWPLLRKAERIHLQGWGEPLLHPRFFDYTALARKAGCMVSTTSCGQRMDENIAEAIVKSGIDVMAFSLAGTDEESNSARAGVSLARVCEAVHTLQQVRKKRMGVHLELHLAYIMLADRVDAVRRLPALMDELDVHAAVVSTLDYIAVPGHAELAFGPHETEKIAAARAVLQEAAATAHAAGRQLHYALPCPQLAPTCREDVQHTLYVDAEGALSPCIYVNVPDGTPKEHVYGFTTRQNPLEVWHSQPFARFREAHGSAQPPAVCAACPKRYEGLE